MKKSLKKKLLATFIFSLIASIAAIVHGVFLDLDTSQIQRLSLGGFIATFIVIFISLRLLEWIFNLEDEEELRGLKRRVGRMEKKR